RSDRDWSSDVCSSDLYGRFEVGDQGRPYDLRLSARVALGERCSLRLDLHAELPAVQVPWLSWRSVGAIAGSASDHLAQGALIERSEERRVGKGCGTRW